MLTENFYQETHKYEAGRRRVRYKIEEEKYKKLQICKEFMKTL